MKILASNILIILLLSSCVKERYLSYQMNEDLEKNRNELYRQSYVGVHNEIPDEK